MSIKAKLVQINAFAYFACSSLTSINIPSTVVFIGLGAISGITKCGGTTSSGVLTVKFEPTSQIKMIRSYVIERKTIIIIFFRGEEAPQVVENAIFYGVTTQIVFSPISLNWRGVETEPDPSVCQLIKKSQENEENQKNTCVPNELIFHHNVLILLIINNIISE